MHDKLYGLINRLVDIAVENQMITARDIIYSRNRLLAAFHENDYKETTPATGNLYETLEALTQIAIARGLVEDTLSQKDIFASTLMNIFLPAPSYIEARFWNLYAQDPQKATAYFYQLSQASNYIKMDRINKNISFHAPSAYGTLDITINLSKPEKDPKDIAKQKTMAATNYPKCLLCVENEGYAGTSTHPDRSNHRTIALELNQRNWRLQYSPYLYYNEHCILLSATHEPMTLTRNSFYNLLDFVKLFPHYFIGSNADLPIVGGSILAHEHYQGGCYDFPIHHAKVLKSFKLNKYPNVTCSLLNWPLSTISLACKDIDELVDCADHIYETWKTYSDEEVGILAATDSTRHNTVTPVARKKGDAYVLDIVLRNNRTTKDYPLGIFHPHEDVWHIKKENIGLIEVMGLAILPARLKKELEEVKAYIVGSSNEVADCHKTWAEILKKDYDGSDIDHYIEMALGEKFTRVLEDAGVYKMTSEGIAHFERFLQTLNA